MADVTIGDIRTSAPADALDGTELLEIEQGGVSKGATVDQTKDYILATSGVVIHQAFTSTGEVVSTTSIIPYDDTIPQDTEGGEALSIAFTPKRSDSRIRIKSTLGFRASSADIVGIEALFISTQTGALAVGHVFADPLTGPSSGSNTVSVTADIASPGTSAVTFSVRFGPHSAATLHLNANNSGARRFGGVSASTLEITEYMP